MKKANPYQWLLFMTLLICHAGHAAPIDAKAPQDARSILARETDIEPVFFIADGLNADGYLLKNYKRGLDYAINYFGNYGPYFVYLLGPKNEGTVRAIYRQRAALRADPKAERSIEEQIAAFLMQSEHH
jgi:hypothetical protein